MPDYGSGSAQSHANAAFIAYTMPDSRKNNPSVRMPDQFLKPSFDTKKPPVFPRGKEERQMEKQQ
jgi:hypothetical protein